MKVTLKVYYLILVLIFGLCSCTSSDTYNKEDINRTQNDTLYNPESGYYPFPYDLKMSEVLYINDSQIPYDSTSVRFMFYIKPSKMRITYLGIMSFEGFVKGQKIIDYDVSEHDKNQENIIKSFKKKLLGYLEKDIKLTKNEYPINSEEYGYSRSYIIINK